MKNTPSPSPIIFITIAVIGVIVGIFASIYSHGLQKAAKQISDASVGTQVTYSHSDPAFTLQYPSSFVVGDVAADSFDAKAGADTGASAGTGAGSNTNSSEVSHAASFDLGKGVSFTSGSNVIELFSTSKTADEAKTDRAAYMTTLTGKDHSGVSSNVSTAGFDGYKTVIGEDVHYRLYHSATPKTALVIAADLHAASPAESSALEALFLRMIGSLK